MYGCCPTCITAIDSLDGFDESLEANGHVAGVVLQGLDLTGDRADVAATIEAYAERP